jgi:NDP-sugar pyrophosphorylase family protein
MSDLHYSSFFQTVPKNIKNYFDKDTNPWGALKGNLKSFFESLASENVILGEVSSLALIEGSHVYIAEGAKVEAGAYIKGPCYIGKNTEVRHSAYIRGNVYVGENCVVGHCTEVKHSIFLDGAKAGHFNYIGDSILGNNVNLGAGTKLANLKMTPGNVILKVDGKAVDSGIRKFGAVIGDSSETGCNSVLNPGTVLAPKSLVFPNVSAFGVHLKRAKLLK